MAKIYYGAGHDDTSSQAELDLLARFETLPDDFTVIHSVPWITHPSANGTVGEADFLIIHPKHGVLVTEVKGGAVRTERKGKETVWHSGPHEIKDPCQQADRNRWALDKWLKNDRRTSSLRYALYPLVMLPDSHVNEDIRPDCTRDIILDMTSVDTLERSLLDAYAYWHGRYQYSQMGGRAAVEALVNLCLPEVNLAPRIAEIFEQERKKIEELTKQQYRVLNRMRKFHRAAIVGGAGTGKTMLAMEKAHQLAEAGMRVLVLCFNRPLADWIGRTLKDENIVVATYQQLVSMALKWAQLGDLTNRMNEEKFAEKGADLLDDALSVIRAPGSAMMDKLFDAIIVDEAQDFEDTWWIPMTDVLKDPENGIFYVFFDDNQRIYTQISNVPMEERPFYLDENCRTTQGIHEAMLRYANTDEEMICRGPDGRPVEHIQASTEKEIKDAVRKKLHWLINEEGVPAEQVVILTPIRKRSIWQPDETMGNFTLLWDDQPSEPGPDTIRVTTIYRYKGLESAAVLLTELDKAQKDKLDQLMYVGLSRARNHVVVVGEYPKAK